MKIWKMKVFYKKNVYLKLKFAQKYPLRFWVGNRFRIRGNQNLFIFWPFGYIKTQINIDLLGSNFFPLLPHSLYYETCIDLVLTDQPNFVVHSGVIQSPDPRCKHQIINGKINFTIPCPPHPIRGSFGVSIGPT